MLAAALHWHGLACSLIPYLVLQCRKCFLHCGNNFLSLPSTVCSWWLLYLLACQSANPSSPKAEYLGIMQMVPECDTVPLRGVSVNSVLRAGEYELAQRWLRTSACKIPSLQRETKTVGWSSHHCVSASLSERSVCGDRPSHQEP